MPYLRLGMTSLFLCQLHCLFIAVDEPHFNFNAVFAHIPHLIGKLVQLPQVLFQMDYKTLSAILGHYSVAFTMDTYVHSMDEHKRREMDKMNDMFGMQYCIFVENQPYPVLCTLSPDGCTAHVPDFPKITAQAGVILAVAVSAFVANRIPRASGGDPMPLFAQSRCILYSPRKRG